MKCEHHDYIEIACLYRYPVRVTLKSGATIEGIAHDTGYKPNSETGENEECLIIDLDGKAENIATDLIASLEVSVENPHFSVANFE